MISIRGAITVNSDTKEEVLKATEELLIDIIQKNNIEIEDIISIIFTCTKDIKSVYPAVAAREIGIVNAGLMCLSEMYVENSIERCIRVLLNADKDIGQKDVKHSYLRDAQKLRPDLARIKKD